MTFHVPIFTEDEKLKMREHLDALQHAAEVEVLADPSRRTQIIERYEADAADYVASARQGKLARTFERLLWGGAFSGAALVLGLLLDWTILAYCGVGLFFTYWGNAWYRSDESYTSTRLFSYVLGGTLVMMGLAFMNFPRRHYDATSTWRLEYKRNSATYKTEVLSGTEMQARELRTLHALKILGTALLILGGTIVLWRVVHDPRARSTILFRKSE